MNTSNSYLELIMAFKTSLASKRQEISAAKRRYEVGLDKLAFATKSVNAMQVRDGFGIEGRLLTAGGGERGGFLSVKCFSCWLRSTVRPKTAGIETMHGQPEARVYLQNTRFTVLLWEFGTDEGFAPGGRNSMFHMFLFKDNLYVWPTEICALKVLPSMLEVLGDR